MRSKSYAYRVSAYDLAGNESEQSISVSALAMSDTVASSVVVYPNPAVGAGANPTIHASLGDVDFIEITIFNQAGKVVHTVSMPAVAVGQVNGENYYEYVWKELKASGVYYAVIHGKKGDTIIRKKVKFAVIK